MTTLTQLSQQSHGLETKNSRAEPSRSSWPRRRCGLAPHVVVAAEAEVEVAEGSVTEVVTEEVAAAAVVAVEAAVAHPWEDHPDRETGNVLKRTVATTILRGGTSAIVARPRSLQD